MKTALILLLTLSASSAFAERKGCIAFHPTRPEFGTTSASYSVICTDQKFTVDSPIDVLWLFGNSEEKFLTDRLESIMKYARNLDLVSTIDPVAPSSWKNPGRKVHIFIKKNLDEKRVYCTLVKYQDNAIGLDQKIKVKDAVVKCEGNPKYQALQLVTNEEAEQFMLEQGLEKDFELDASVPNTGSKSIAVYSKSL
jgi:hypothetical protein